MTALPVLVQNIQTVPIVYLDLETTGLTPAAGDRVCEIAMLRVYQGRVEHQFTTLINPQRLLNPRAAEVNGISADMLVGAPTFAMVLPQVLQLLRDAVIIAHNAAFDQAFLLHELALSGYPPPANRVLDTLSLARRLVQASSYSLHALAASLHLPEPSHRAMSDVLALKALFEYLVLLMAEHQIVTIEQVFTYQQGIFTKAATAEPPPLITQALHEGRCLRIVYVSRGTPAGTDRLVRPIELIQQKNGLFLRAYCYLRHDLRMFALHKIESMELV
ncbi:MAG: WYL domain-containing protein [Chloroflexaceae bacterium]|nr:WYL domain-containing protein [Chloroflexaceae bacterium]